MGASLTDVLRLRSATCRTSTHSRKDENDTSIACTSDVIVVAVFSEEKSCPRGLCCQVVGRRKHRSGVEQLDRTNRFKQERLRS